jgi:hypothetical protein
MYGFRERGIERGQAVIEVRHRGSQGMGGHCCRWVWGSISRGLRGGEKALKHEAMVAEVEEELVFVMRKKQEEHEAKIKE